MKIEHFEGELPDAPLVTLIEGWALGAPETYKHRVVYAYVRHLQGRAQRALIWSGNDERVATSAVLSAAVLSGDYNADMACVRDVAMESISSISVESGFEYDLDEWIPPARVLDRRLAAKGLFGLHEYVRERADDTLRQNGTLPGLTYVLLPSAGHGSPFVIEAQPKDTFHKFVIGDYVSALGDLHEYVGFLVVHRGTFRPGDPAARQDLRGTEHARDSGGGLEQTAVVNISGSELNGRNYVRAYELVSDGETVRLGEDVIPKNVGPEVAARAVSQGRMVPRFGWEGHEGYKGPG